MKWLLKLLLVLWLCAAVCVLGLLEWQTGLLSQGVQHLTGAIEGQSTSTQQSRSLTAGLQQASVVVRAPGRRADLQPLDGAGELLEQEPEQQQPTENLGEELSFPARLYPYFSMLDAGEQALYRQTYANAAALSPQFRLTAPLTAQQVERALTAVLYDHPELFWLDHSYRYSYLKDGTVVSLTLVFNATAQNIQSSRARFEAAAQAILQQAAAYDTVREKEQFVHDALLDAVEYDLQAPLNQSAYSALVGGASVCAGYSRAFQYLMMALDIPCYYCAGDAGGSHAWNIIGLDEGYYHVDLSWDDPVDNPDGSYYYSYYNLTDAEMQEDHVRRGLSLNLPACNGPQLSRQNPVGTGGRKRYTDLGFIEADILPDLPAYYDACYDELARLGVGSHTLHFLLADEALQQAVYNATQNKDYLKGYFNDVVQTLQLTGYSVQLELSAESLAQGYYHLTQTVHLEGTTQQPRPDEQHPPRR